MRVLFLFFGFMVYGIAEAQTVSVNQEKFITIGGIEQWISIKGNDTSKPMILFLHGGPGSIMSPFDTMFSAWKNEYILVQWDQRGAGRTFGRNAPPSPDEDYWTTNKLSVDLLVSDAIELSEYLIKYFNKKKIIISGTSWGSVIGIEISLRRPDLYHAYIGHSQIVNPREGMLNAFNKTMDLARNNNDTATINSLVSLQPLPFDDARNAGKFLRIVKKYERSYSKASPDFWWEPSFAYNNKKDESDRENGDDYSFINYVGHKKLGIEGMINDIDLFNRSVIFRIPVFILQGEYDILTPSEISRLYFDRISSPLKEFHLISGADHGLNESVLEVHFRILASLSLLLSTNKL